MNGKVQEKRQRGRQVKGGIAADGFDRCNLVADILPDTKCDVMENVLPVFEMILECTLGHPRVMHEFID